MDVKTLILEILKLVCPLALAYIGVLKNRTDLDKFAARTRARESGLPIESQMRHRWYHGRWLPRRKVKIDEKDFPPL